MYEADARPVICFPFVGDSVGGSHVSVLGLLRKLDPSEFRCVIVPEVADGRIAALFEEFEILEDPSPVRTSAAPGQPFGPMSFARAMRGLPERVRFLRRHNVRIVHSNDGRTHAAWAPAARVASIPLLWHHRGDPSAAGLRLVAPILASRVLAVSSFALPRPGVWSSAKRAEVVHSPFDTQLQVDRESARQSLATELMLDPTTVIVGYFGSFVPRKRPLVFIDAVAKLRQLLDRPVAGVMFGEARERAWDERVQRRAAAPDVSGSIHLMGHRVGGAYWIGACDQLLVPAVGEPFGRTLVEAMVVGTPVIAARSGGNIEALAGGNGILVPPDDPLAMAKACSRLAADAELSDAIAKKAAATSRERFGEDRHSRRVSQVYQELIAERSSSNPRAAEHGGVRKA